MNTATATATNAQAATATATATDSDVAPPGSTPTGTPTPRPRPGRVSFTGADSTHNSITVYWSVPDPPASEYVLRGGRDNNVKQNIYSGSATSFTWTGLDANTKHYFSVYGNNGPGSSSGPFGYVKLVWTKVDPDDLADYVPGAPTGLTAANTEDGVKLTWDNPTCSPPGRVCNNVDLGDVYEHQIDRRRGSNNRWQAIGQSGPAGRYTDTSARLGTTYTYRVRARNRHGLSNAATITLTYTLVPPPAKPGAPTVVNVGISGNQVQWANPNDSSITSFIVLRRRVEPGAVFTSLAERAPSGFNYIYNDTGVTCGVEYAYRIQARNEGGLSPQSSSTRAPVIPCPTPTPTPDPCAGVCVSKNVRCERFDYDCTAQESACGCDCSQCLFCGTVFLGGFGGPIHHRLHDMMPFDEVVAILHGVEWMENQELSARMMLTHPYYTLHEVK